MSTIENGKRYKWAYPSDWLNDEISHADEHELRGICQSLMSKLPEDDIQDLFQSEMAADGYFRIDGSDEDEDA